MPLIVFAKCFFSLLILLTANSAFAQTFSPQGLSAPQKSPLASEPAKTKNITTEKSASTDEAIDRLTQALSKKETKKTTDADDPLAQLSKAFSSSQKNQQALLDSSDEDDDEEEEDDDDEEKEEDIFIPEGELYRLDTPTLDGSFRGGQAFVEVDDKGRMKKTTKIFLFYDEFRIINSNAKIPTCNVRFNILSTLDRKITQLDVKLVWPGLTTTLSFSNVMPNTQTYYNYALLSAGCFNMDKAPNIVVNRCRVKGMTSMECADKLLWLSK